MNFGFKLNASKVAPIFGRLVSQATVLAFFTNLTSRFDVNDIIGRMTQSPEFLEFVENNKHKSGKDICKEFVIIALYSHFDDYASKIIEDQHIQTIFNDDSLSDTEKFHAFMGKLFMQFLAGGPNKNASPMLQKMMKVPEFKEMVKDAIKLGDLVRRNNIVESPEHFYHLAIDFASDHIIDTYFKDVDILRLNGMECKNQEPIYDATVEMIDRFNSLLNHTPRYSRADIGKKRKRDSNNNETDNDKQRPKKRPKNNPKK